MNQTTTLLGYITKFTKSRKAIVQKFIKIDQIVDVIVDYFCPNALSFLFNTTRYITWSGSFLNGEAYHLLNIDSQIKIRYTIQDDIFGTTIPTLKRVTLMSNGQLKLNVMIDYMDMDRPGFFEEQITFDFDCFEATIVVNIYKDRRMTWEKTEQF